MKIISLIAIILLFLISGIKSETVNLYGFRPASLISADIEQTLEFKNRPRQTRENVIVTILAKIDQKGKIKSLKVNEEKDSLYLSYLEEYLKDHKFKPARLNNKKIKSVLPIEIDFCNKISSPILKFPLLDDTLIVDNDFFEYAATLNKIQLANILSFPAYFSNIKVSDSVEMYPFVLEKLTYKNGELVTIENEMSTHDPFVAQIESAILYSQIELPKVEKTKSPTILYLMVSFFPELSYPVAVYDADLTDSTNLLHHNRVRIINRYSYLLSEPIPKRVPSDTYAKNLFGANFIEPIDILIRVKKDGSAGVLRGGGGSKRIMKSIRSLVSKLDFYPAITQDNSLVDFSGYLRIEPFDELNIRISYLWMR